MYPHEQLSPLAAHTHRLDAFRVQMPFLDLLTCHPQPTIRRGGQNKSHKALHALLHLFDYRYALQRVEKGPYDAEEGPCYGKRRITCPKV